MRVLPRRLPRWWVTSRIECCATRVRQADALQAFVKRARPLMGALARRCRGSGNAPDVQVHAIGLRLRTIGSGERRGHQAMGYPIRADAGSDKDSTMKRKPAAKRAIKEAKLSRTHPPVDVSPADWQRALRRQFGRDQMFRLENRGDQPFFSEFRISNPQSKAGYRVAIRGLSAGDNYCSCPDYATNELGTCKHIEFVLARLGKKRGAKAAFTRGWRPAFSEIYLRNDGGRAVHFRAGSDCPPALLKAAARLFDASRGGLLPEGRFNELEHFLATSTGSGHELRAYDDALDFIAGRRDAARRAEILDRQFPRGASDRKLAQLLKAPLYPYQADGALFAVRAGRALIGDEMGLGKTIQAIAAMEILARHFGVSRVLVVCPTSLKYQWQNEISRFSGRAARVMAGGWAQRQQDFRADEFCKITNYEKLKPDLDLIAEWAPELVIVDEAQRIKNWNTIAARALKRIDSPYALVLTGTPLENKLEELISIVQFVDQHRLGPTWKLLYEHQAKDETGRVTGYTGLQKIGQTLAPILIRRRRSEVLTQLPSRTDQNLLVPMTEMQLVHHQENADIVAKIVARWRRMQCRWLGDMLGAASHADSSRLTSREVHDHHRQTYRGHRGFRHARRRHGPSRAGGRSESCRDRSCRRTGSGYRAGRGAPDRRGRPCRHRRRQDGDRCGGSGAGRTRCAGQHRGHLPLRDPRRWQP